MKSSTEVDLYRHVSLHVQALDLFGIWLYIPHSMRTVKFWWSVLSRIIIGMVIFVIPTGGQIVYLVKLLMSGNAEIQEVAAVVNLILTELLTSLKLLDLRLRREQFTQLIDQLVNAKPHYFQPIHTEMRERSVKLARTLYVGVSICTYCDVIVHMIVVPALHGFERLPLKMDLIWFDVNSEENFIYVCAFQIFYKPTMITTFIILQTLPWAVMLHAISELDILIHNLVNMEKSIKLLKLERNYSEREAFKEIFNKCVMHHCDIKRYVNTIQLAFGGQFSLFLILNAVILGITGVHILSIDTSVKNITDITWVLLYLTLFVTLLFMDCYYANAITHKSLHVATLVYSSPWLKLSNGLKRNLITFIAQTQQPLVITAAKLVPVSIETFTKVMNWTYKGFAVLNQMKK